MYCQKWTFPNHFKDYGGCLRWRSFFSIKNCFIFLAVASISWGSSDFGLAISKMDANPNAMFENVLFRCTSFGRCFFSGKRMDQFEIWRKIHNQDSNYLQVCNLNIFPFSYRSLTNGYNLAIHDLEHTFPFFISYLPRCRGYTNSLIWQLRKYNLTAIL